MSENELVLSLTRGQSLRIQLSVENEVAKPLHQLRHLNLYLLRALLLYICLLGRRWDQCLGSPRRIAFAEHINLDKKIVGLHCSVIPNQPVKAFPCPIGTTPCFISRTETGRKWLRTCGAFTAWSRCKREIENQIERALGKKAFTLEDSPPKWRRKRTFGEHRAGIREGRWKTQTSQLVVGGGGCADAGVASGHGTMVASTSSQSQSPGNDPWT